MTERLDERYHAPETVRRRYLWEWMLWLLLGLAIGATVALAEYCRWLPRHFSNFFAFPPREFVPLMGALISQTISVPLLFLAGLHPASFYYTSRLICLFFCFWRGLDLWKCLFAMKNAPGYSNTLAVMLVMLILCMMCLLLRATLIATGGMRRGRRLPGQSPSAYFTSLFEFWGAMILAQTAFYLLYRCFI
jgi:hypothetical protein